MAKKSQNGNFHKAKTGKNDEFYTQLTDIEKEAKHYKEHFAGKTIYCNCDDPEWSNFFRYFALKFEDLKIKKLIATHFVHRDMFVQGDAYKLETTKGLKLNADGKFDLSDIKTKLKDNGDFNSAECIELLKEADIVVTNPPFSLFREYVTQLVEFDKKFLIIGNINAITYKEIFKLIQENKAWVGVNMGRGISGFIVPKHYELYGSEARIDSSGERIVSTNNCLWLTNLDITKRHEDIILYKKYSSEEYPTYDNFDAINVDKTKDIPFDYSGAMGVPITFLDKYNPEQFEILGNEYDLNIEKGRGYVAGKRMYSRIFIKNKKL